MQIVEELDAGATLLQREVAVAPGEHAPELQERLSVVGAELLVETLERLEEGTIEPRPQDERQATFAPPLQRADGEIDPSLTAAEIEGRVRGFDPWPGVWVGCGPRRLRLVDAQDTGRVGPAATVGEVLSLEREGLLIACGAGTLLRVLAIQPEGRRVMSARDAVNGRQLRPGERLQRLARSA
jgi:methionyl-tRNA formyltransferase